MVNVFITNISFINCQSISGLPSMLQHKIAISFKDHLVFQVFQMFLTSPHQLKNDRNTLVFMLDWYLCIFFLYKLLFDCSINFFLLTSPPHQKKVGSKLQELTLSVSFNVLVSDLMGTSFDESHMRLVWYWYI